MSIDNALRAPGAVPAVTRALLVLVLAVSVLLTLVAAISGIGALVAEAGSGTLSAELTASGAAPGVGVGGVVSARYSSADVVVRHVPPGVLLLATTADASGVLGRLALGAGLVLMLLAVLRRSPFSSATALAVTLIGAIAAIATVLQIGLGVLSDLTLADLLTRSGAGSWPPASAADLSPLAAGFGLMIVGLLLGHGDQLRRATHGLV